MDRDAMWLALDGERAATVELLESLTSAEWEHASLCAGWRVREVAAHLTLGPGMGVGGAVVEFARARGSFNRMVDSTARRKAAVPTGNWWPTCVGSSGTGGWRLGSRSPMR